MEFIHSLCPKMRQHTTVPSTNDCPYLQKCVPLQKFDPMSSITSDYLPCAVSLPIPGFRLYRFRPDSPQYEPVPNRIDNTPGDPGGRCHGFHLPYPYGLDLVELRRPQLSRYLTSILHRKVDRFGKITTVGDNGISPCAPRFHDPRDI
jgi:hypothetical protein